MQRLAPRLESDRLVLSAHTVDDFAAMAKLWSDRDVVRFIGGRPSTREETWARLLRYAGSWTLLGFGFWAIRDKSGFYLGEAGLLQGQRALDPGFGDTPEVGWALSPAAQGKGHAREALETILGWTDQHGLRTTACLIEPANTASIRLAEKLGYQQYAQSTYHGARVNLYRRGPAV